MKVFVSTTRGEEIPWFKDEAVVPGVGDFIAVGADRVVKVLWIEWAPAPDGPDGSLQGVYVKCEEA